MSRGHAIIFVLLANCVFYNCGRIVPQQRTIRDLTSGVRSSQDKIVNETSGLNNKPEDLCPYKSKELCLILALSKIAKVQLGDGNHGTMDRDVKSQVNGDAEKSLKTSFATRKIKDTAKPAGDVEQLFETDEFVNSTRKPVNSESVHCQAIRDIYIPEVREKLPAYACLYQNKTFILSSQRFLQDRRSHLDISIDENTIKNIKSVRKVSRSKEFNVIPALLVSKESGNDYKIRTHENIFED